jgi:hypothetical protein
MLENDEYEKAVRVIAQKKNIDKYAAFIDFFHCELFPEWKSECFRYYEGKAVLFKNHPLSTEERINKLDAFLCKCLGVAKIIVDRNPRIPSWGEFQWMCLNLVNGGEELVLRTVPSTRNLTKR